MPQPVLFRRSAQSSSHCPAFIQSTVKARSACPCPSSEVHHHSLQMYGLISKRGSLSPHGQRLQRKLKVLQGALMNTQTPHNNYLAITFRNSMSCANTALDYEHLTLLLLFAVTGDPRHLSLQWPQYCPIFCSHLLTYIGSWGGQVYRSSTNRGCEQLRNDFHSSWEKYILPSVISAITVFPGCSKPLVKVILFE